VNGRKGIARIARRLLSLRNQSRGLIRVDVFSCSSCRTLSVRHFFVRPARRPRVLVYTVVFGRTFTRFYNRHKRAREIKSRSDFTSWNTNVEKAEKIKLQIVSAHSYTVFARTIVFSRSLANTSDYEKKKKTLSPNAFTPQRDAHTAGSCGVRPDGKTSGWRFFFFGTAFPRRRRTFNNVFRETVCFVVVRVRYRTYQRLVFFDKMVVNSYGYIIFVSMFCGNKQQSLDPSDGWRTTEAHKYPQCVRIHECCSHSNTNYCCDSPSYGRACVRLTGANKNRARFVRVSVLFSVCAALRVHSTCYAL